MQAGDVHAQIEALLGERVRRASVKATLAGNVHGPSPRFVRVARGRYRLADRPCPQHQTPSVEPEPIERGPCLGSAAIQRARRPGRRPCTRSTCLWD